jgi:hypothetical protein
MSEGFRHVWRDGLLSIGIVFRPIANMEIGVLKRWLSIVEDQPRTIKLLEISKDAVTLLQVSFPGRSHKTGEQRYRNNDINSSEFHDPSQDTDQTLKVIDLQLLPIQERSPTLGGIQKKWEFQFSLEGMHPAKLAHAQSPESNA